MSALMSSTILQANRETDIVGGDTGRGLFGRGQLLMGGGGRVDHQALGVADVGEMREQFDGVDELLASL